MSLQPAALLIIDALQQQQPWCPPREVVQRQFACRVVLPVRLEAECGECLCRLGGIVAGRPEPYPTAIGQALKPRLVLPQLAYLTFELLGVLARPEITGRGDVARQQCAGHETVISDPGGLPATDTNIAHDTGVFGRGQQRDRCTMVVGGPAFVVVDQRERQGFQQ